MYVCMYIYIYMYYVCICIYIYMCIHIYIYIYIYIHVYIYIYIRNIYSTGGVRAREPAGRLVAGDRRTVLSCNKYSNTFISYYFT